MGNRLLDSMTGLSRVLVVAFLLFIPAAVRAGIVTVPVAADASINRANELGNLNGITTGGGLLVGLDDTGPDYSSYLKFLLPALAAEESITSARLVGFYKEALGGGSRPFLGAFFVPDDSWTENEITAATAPASEGSNAAGIDTGGLTPGGDQPFSDFGLAGVVDREARGDRVLSLLLGTIDGRFDDLQGFISKDFDGTRAFRLELTTSAAVAIPLPPAVLSALTLIPVTAYFRRRPYRVESST